MSNHAQQVVQKLWNYCNVLRDDGLSYGDYVEQLTYLLFLKMAHEQTQPPLRRPSPIPAGYDWPSLMARDGDDARGPLPAHAGDSGKRGACSASSSARRRTRSRTRPSSAA